MLLSNSSQVSQTGSRKYFDSSPVKKLKFLKVPKEHYSNSLKLAIKKIVNQIVTRSTLAQSRTEFPRLTKLTFKSNDRTN